MKDVTCCCIDTDFYEAASVSSDKIVRARKRWECCECPEPIQPGEEYHYVRGLWDGTWRTFRTCMPCKRIRDEYMTCGFVYGQLGQDLKECWGFDYRTVPTDEEDDDA